MASFVLVPLLTGLLYWGNYFWQAQRVASMEITGIPPASVAGSYTCNQLLDRVKSLLTGNVSSLAAQLGVPASAIAVTTSVVTVLPTIGVDIAVSVSVPIAHELVSILPLPDDGALVQSVTQRLENVKVSTTSC